MDTILVGVGGSPDGDAALAWALTEAVTWGASVTVLHAWQPLPYAMYAPGLPMAPQDAVLGEQQAETLLAATLKRAREAVPAADGVELTGRAVVGPAPVALEQASRHADLVVVGCREQGAVARTVLGSTSSAVLHHARCPVVLVPAGSRPPDAGGRIVVGVDPTAASTAALAWSAAEAERRGCRLLAVHVRPSMNEVTGDADVTAVQAASLDWLTGRLAAVVSRGLADPEVRVGTAGEELIRGLGVDDLLVVGSRGLGPLSGWLLGSTSGYACHHAPCPVAVVREPGEVAHTG